MTRVTLSIRANEGGMGIISGTNNQINDVMKKQNDLTEVLHRLKQVVCVKR